MTENEKRLEAEYRNDEREPGKNGHGSDPSDSDDNEVVDLQHVHPADAADHLENMELTEQTQIVRELPLEDAAEAISEMDEHARIALLEQLDPELAADILEEMSPDDAADALDELGEELQKRLLRRVEAEEAAEIRHLMRYEPDTAGGIMNTEVVVLEQNLTVDQAIKRIREEIEDKEIPYYGYLVDGNGRLQGVVSLRELIMGRSGVRLGEMVRHQTLISVVFDVDREEVATLLGHYNFLAMPVTDYDGKLLGIVTHDDIFDIMHEEASEDMLGMVGAGVDETVDTPWRQSVLKRFPWLIINLVNSGLAAYVVHLFEGTIAQMAILAALMHIVSNQGGNTGQQSLAVMIRQLAMERFDRKRSWAAVIREAKIGLSNGILIGAMLFLLVLMVMENLALAQVISLALLLDMFIGAVAGASIPLVLKELGRDPAQASSIFLTTFTDVMGFFIFLGLAVLMLF